ncbi:NnrU family protein [Lutibaculum baratangense]|uniref:NnrU family protein, required for expression of nitric oxide and nitrite reductases (Nir and Nor) n=1 Tax=Lutibaculum baratangense AMV1 TaxID=631454 RepID=V4RK25_9HYPH|nr:NnrU family protein [Lutibaculum baratangense]ESR23610.1 NnrU family protein, required for expression of nitric oxide and nitrite reductases (Nir and Nor) [Lutibaculum baratangense AMV1]
MFVLVLGLVLFLGVHSERIVAPGFREAFIARRGDNAWKGLYSLLSLLGIVLVVWGYGLARLDPVVIYSPPVWMRHISLVLLMPVFVLIVSAYAPGHIKAKAKHPMLAAVKLWAFAHLLANGTLADVLLFGSFLAWAVVDRISLKRRPASKPGHEVKGQPNWANDVIALVVGATIYVAFLLFLHEWLIGVSPLA